MPTEIKGFITRDDFTLPNSEDVATLFELSDIARTYSKYKQEYNTNADRLYTLHVFEIEGSTLLTEAQVDSIISVIKALVNYLTTNISVNKAQEIVVFSSNYNSLNPNDPILGLNYNSIITYNNIKATDYVTFTVNDVTCSLWLNDFAFRTFYPSYDIKITLPFDNFSVVMSNVSNTIAALDAFDHIEFIKRIDIDKENQPPTFTVVINIPYQIPNTSVTRPCYFGFNIYGIQGNFPHILKLELYEYLVNVLGMDSATVSSLLPSILNINEFFLIPRWDRLAIDNQVGQSGINTQISSTYEEVFDTNKFIKIYDNVSFMRNNTYNFPVDFNNMLIHVTNGLHSEEPVRDFKEYYRDILAVTSIDPDFARMSTRTQNFLTLLSNMLDVADSKDGSEFFNNLQSNQSYVFSIITREGISYLSYRFEDHQYYVIPKHEYMAAL